MERTWKGSPKRSQPEGMAVGPEASTGEGARSICDNTRQGKKRSNCLRSLRSRTGGCLAESLTFLQGEARRRAHLLSNGRLPRVTLPLGQSGELLLSCSNTCWVFLGSFQVCGILWPFLFWLDRPNLSSCILPLGWLWDNT